MASGIIIEMLSDNLIVLPKPDGPRNGCVVCDFWFPTHTHIHTQEICIKPQLNG